MDVAEPLAEISAAESATAAYEAHIPLRRMGEPHDIATAVLVVVSETSRAMAGSLLAVDGGFLLS
jgi:3-oxoacyl-[acyl-carrier protein] reductase